MFLILPAVMALIFLIQSPLSGRRGRILRSYTLMGSVILAVTESLSVFHAVNPAALFITWLCIAIALAVVLLRRRFRFHVGDWETLKRPGLLLPPALLLFATLVIALAAPPNNWDSMTYHMARVANWAAQGSVAHYPTSVLRQLVLSPWAEYAILNLQVLAGGSDRFAMLVQWSAFGISALAVSMILRDFSYSRRTQYLGAMFVLTMPMAILQATSTQNDLMAAAWMAAFVYFIMKPERDFWYAALALGLAVNTKGTAVLIVPAFAIGAWIYHSRRAGWRSATIRFAGMAAVALLLNIPFFVRNAMTFGSPAGEQALVNSVKATSFDPAHILSSVVRQMSIHWGTPIGRVTWGIERGIIRAHEAIGLDASDRRTSYTQFHVIAPSNHEDEAPNPLHFWLIVAGCAVILVKRRSGLSAAFVVELCIAFLLFSAALKWQIWASRLQLPLFVLGGVAAAAGFQEVFQSRRANRILVALLFVTCLPWVFLNRSRPLVTVAFDPSGPGYKPGTARSMLVNWLPAKSVLTADRTSQMFINRKFLQQPYKAALASINADKCREIGLITKEDSWEYPLHVLARDLAEPPHFRHVGVLNASGSIPVRSEPLCALIVLDEPPAAGAGISSITLGNRRFAKFSQDTLIRVFKLE